MISVVVIVFVLAVPATVMIVLFGMSVTIEAIIRWVKRRSAQSDAEVLPDADASPPLGTVP